MPTGPSIIATGLRGRVERLLNGDIRSDDISELFFNMREESGGKGTVSEIANFLAHPGIRNQGIVTQDTRDIFAFWKFWIPYGRSTIVTTDLPPTIRGALKANVRRIRKTVLKAETGLNRVQAEKILDRILGRMLPTPGGGVTKAKIFDQQELAVFQCIARYCKGGALFKDDDLFEDFCRALQRQRLLRTNEKQRLKKAKPALSLFALIAMHNRAIDLGDGTTANLKISADIEGGLGTFAFGLVDQAPGGGSTTIGVWIFETDLPIPDYCEPGTAPLDRSPFIGDFEITRTLKLGRPS